MYHIYSDYAGGSAVEYARFRGALCVFVGYGTPAAFDERDVERITTFLEHCGRMVRNAHALPYVLRTHTAEDGTMWLSRLKENPTKYAWDSCADSATEFPTQAAAMKFAEAHVTPLEDEMYAYPVLAVPKEDPRYVIISAAYDNDNTPKCSTVAVVEGFFITAYGAHMEACNVVDRNERMRPDIAVHVVRLDNGEYVPEDPSWFL